MARTNNGSSPPSNQRASSQFDGVFEFLAAYSDPYDEEHFTPRVTDVGLDRDRVTMAAPTTFLAFLYRHYAFNRAGGAKAGYSTIARNALAETGMSDPDALWREFQRRCHENGVGINERVNRGAVKETAALVEENGNLFKWVGTCLRDGRELTPLYEAINDVNGFGEKITRFFIRDAVWVTETEDYVEPSEAAYLHPMDVWTRRTAQLIYEDAWSQSDAEIAELLAAGCLESNVSHAEFNQGAWYFAAKEANGDPETVVETLTQHI